MSRTVRERTDHGRGARGQAPRSGHGAFEPSPDRADPIALLERQAATRVPELVPIRHERMASSPFAFFRGAALIMAADLARTPTSGINVQLCGDAHLSNFGLFASPERQLVFDINDFDETLPGPWEWDVKRLAASLEVAGRENGFAEIERRTVVRAAVTQYRVAMREFASWTNLQVWYASLAAEARLADIRATLDRATVKRVERTLSKAKTRDHLQAFGKLVQADGAGLRFMSDPPLLVPVEELLGESELAPFLARIDGALAGYRSSLSVDRRHLLDQYTLVHVARKVVGVGSVGTRAWVALLVGRDEQDPLILQIKEAQRSVLEEFAGDSAYDHAGHRVVAGQRTMQASSDILLGWETVSDFDGIPRHFYVRQLRDWKGNIEVEQMSPSAMARYAELCAWTLARGHARSGDRIAIASYLGRGPVFENSIADFAAAYAEQNALDHQALLAAIAAGRVESSITPVG
jgi:uncharacterized protein (DUF2252 family)